MAFDWPGFADVTYRLWRLRRLLALATIVPVLVLSVLALTGVSDVGGSVTGWALRVAVLFAIVAIHAVLFPNAHEETLALSLVTALFVLVAGVAPGSFLAWLVFLVVAIWLFLSGTGRILHAQMMSRTHQPVFRAKIRVRGSAERARQWFPLRPGMARGNYRCGEVGPDGSFPVWYTMPQVDMFDALGIEAPELEHLETVEEDPTFYAVIEKDAADHVVTKIYERPLSEGGAAMTTTEHWFRPSRGGCVVTESDAPAEYARGLSFGLWLTDFQKDGLVFLRDLLEERESRALRAAHRWSLTMLGSRRILRRMVGRNGCAAGVAGLEGSPLSEEKLDALLARLGPDYRARGHTDGPMPLVTLSEFFDGNTDDASFQGALIERAGAGLRDLAARQEVADIRMGVTQWDGPGSWPLAEYIYIVTSAGVEDVRRWVKEAGIWVDEMAETGEHRALEVLEVPEGHRVVWAWID